MRYWKLGDGTFVATEDDKTPGDVGFEGGSWTEMSNEPSEIDSIKSALEFDGGKALEWARAEIERKSAEAASALVPDLRRQMMIFAAWNEVQRLKLAMAVGQVPATVAERQRQFPLIMALSALTGADPLDVATQIETRYWTRVRDMVLTDAKMLLAHDEAAAAATPEAMIDVAQNWKAD